MLSSAHTFSKKGSKCFAFPPAHLDKREEVMGQEFLPSFLSSWGIHLVVY